MERRWQSIGRREGEGNLFRPMMEKPTRRKEKDEEMGAW